MNPAITDLSQSFWLVDIMRGCMAIAGIIRVKSADYLTLIVIRYCLIYCRLIFPSI
jgi:hypothetical protein